MINEAMEQRCNELMEQWIKYQCISTLVHQLIDGLIDQRINQANYLPLSISSTLPKNNDKKVLIKFLLKIALDCCKPETITILFANVILRLCRKIFIEVIVYIFLYCVCTYFI